MNIRLASVDDYKHIAQIHNTMVPDFHETADKLIAEDKIREGKIKHCRWVSVINGKIIGEAFYTQLLTLYHPNKFVIGAYVLPEYQNRGVGSALYEVIIKSLNPYDPIYYHVFARENLPKGISFLSKRGFKEIYRERVSHLNLKSFDLSKYVDFKIKLEAEGIVFKKLKELQSESDYKHKLYKLEWELYNDIPEHTEPPVKPSYEEWLKSGLNHPESVHEAYNVAIMEGEYIGYSYLWGGAKKKIIHNAMTGVKRKYRGKRIALILKVLGIKYAKESGYSILWTSNSVTNPAILAVNDKLGYVKQYETVEMIKRLREG